MWSKKAMTKALVRWRTSSGKEGSVCVRERVCVCVRVSV